MDTLFSASGAHEEQLGRARRWARAASVVPLDRQEEKGASEDEMVGWHHGFNGHEFEQTQGDSEGQGSLPDHTWLLAEVHSIWACPQVDSRVHGLHSWGAPAPEHGLKSSGTRA